MTKRYKSARKAAYDAQSGRCFYCSFLMWLDSPAAFAATHALTLPQAKHFQCTAEHVVAKVDGGSDARSNLVAACHFCNKNRHKHRPNAAPSADEFKQTVMRRVDRKRWGPAWIYEAALPIAARH